MNKKYIVKSSSDYTLFLINCIFILGGFIFTFDAYNSIFINTISSLVALLISYFSLFWTNIFYFYNDKIEVVYLFRVRRRKRTINYANIKHVQYNHLVGGKARSPYIILGFDDEPFPKLFKPSNSFPVNSIKKRKVILKLLVSKGILIEIKSDSDEDKDILN